MRKTIGEIALVWRENKRRYVKRATYAAYALILENHILPEFGDCEGLSENLVQEFALRKLGEGLSVKTVKDILIVLKMVVRFGAKNEWTEHCDWNIRYPTTEVVKEMEVLPSLTTGKSCMACVTVSPRGASKAAATTRLSA